MGPNEQGINYSVEIDSFFIANIPVTQKLWRTVKVLPSLKILGDNLPVTRISWLEATQFCNALSRMYRRTECYDFSKTKVFCDFSKNGFRLPTEAEWEYAARGGKKSKGYLYSGSSDINEVAWHSGNSNNQVIRVGCRNKKQNELGLWDMSGNIWEWCWDWFDAYPDRVISNPTGPKEGGDRVLRGGSYEEEANKCTVFSRHLSFPTSKGNAFGLRLVCSKM